MNLTIRDAIALGRSLSEIAKFDKSLDGTPDSKLHFKEETLARFNTERRARAIQVIKMTKFLNWALGLQSARAQALRNVIWWVMGSAGIGRVIAVKLGGVEAKGMLASFAVPVLGSLAAVLTAIALFRR